MGLPLLLLSHLAQHTRNLHHNLRCSILLTEPGHGDVQQLGRLTCLSRAEALEPVPEGLSRRYFRYFPTAREYHEILNFRFYRLLPQRFYYIGGFGSARWITPDHLLDKPALGLDQETELLQRLQAEPPFSGDGDGDAAPSVVGLDPFGMDYQWNGQLNRAMFRQPAGNPERFLEAIRELNLTRHTDD